MDNEEHLQKLKQGVEVWNRWRDAHPDIVTDLSAADLSAVNLSKANLTNANLFWASLIRANLSEANLSKANLSKASLPGARLYHAILNEADLSDAHLNDANLQRAELCNADLQRASLDHAELHGANLSGADLRDTFLFGARLIEANLGRAQLSRADLRMANLIEAILDEAILTGALLWETQRSQWSIQGIICLAVYWDQDKRERTTYSPGEFERLFADKTKVVLHYEGGISPIEIATLPALIQRIEATHPGCILRLQSVQEDAGGATVTLLVEDGGGRSPEEIGALKTDIEVVSQRAIRAQRALLEERRTREQAELKLQILYDEIFPRTVRLIMEKSQSIQISISGGTVHGNIVGEVSGENAQVHYTHNDLAAIEALMSEIHTHGAELPLTSAERIQFEEKLNAIQEQLTAQAPNHSLLREGLHTVRHILEAGVAHALVGQWLPLLHKLG